MKRTFKVFASVNATDEIRRLLYPIKEGSQIWLEQHGNSIWVWVADVGAYAISKVGDDRFKLRHVDDPDLGDEMYDSESLPEWAERVYYSAMGWN